MAPAHQHNGAQHGRGSSEGTWSQRYGAFKRAKRLQDAGRADEALDVVLSALHRHPSDTHLLSLGASLLVKTRASPQRIEQLLHTGRAAHPDLAPLTTAAAMLHASQGRHEQAVQELSVALERSPGDPVLLQVRCGGLLHARLRTTPL
jgi:Flp pilus assembly protein TadD